MKQIFTKISFLLILLSACSLQAETTIEVRAAAFFPSTHLFRSLYGNVNPSYSIEGATSLNFGGCDSECDPCNSGGLLAFANFDWFNKNGHSKCGHDSTRVRIGNFSTGLKYAYAFNRCVEAYLGIGPSVSKIWIHNSYECSSSHRNKERWVVGGVVKLGVNYDFNECMYVDLFVDYLYQPVHFNQHHHVDIGGFKTGIGLGARF